MLGYFPVYLYFGLVLFVTLVTLGISGLFRIGRDKPGSAKYLPYESGIRTQTNLFHERFTLHHYLVALVFLIFDVEIVFLYPWATIAKQLGPFAFYEILFFFFVLLVGFAYVWRKGGLNWE